MSHEVDEISIENGDLLWRRILDQPSWWKEDNGTIRPSSASFQQRQTNNGIEKGVSVQLAKLTSIESASTVVSSAGIAELTVQSSLDIGLNVVYDPIETDVSHTLICPQNGERITKSQAKKMAMAARMILLPQSKRNNPD